MFDVLYGVKQTTMAQEQGSNTHSYNIYAEEHNCITKEYVVKKSFGDVVYEVTTFTLWTPVGTPFVKLTEQEYALYMNSPSKFDVNDYGVKFLSLEGGELADIVVTKNGVGLTQEQYDTDQVYLDVKDKVGNGNDECLVEEHGWTFVSEVDKLEGAYEILLLECGSETSSDSD